MYASCYMDIIAIVKELIQKALENEGLNQKNVLVDFPKDLSFGDLTSNVALQYAKEKNQNPVDFAKSLVLFMNEIKPREVDSIDFIAPGFINFKLVDKKIGEILLSVISKKEGLQKYAGKKILVEHSSPNLFKPFHIGHVMNNTIGESISRLAKVSGASVDVISYPSDISLGIGKAVYAALLDGKETLITLSSEKEQLEYLGACYAKGTRLFEEDDAVKTRVREITENLYEHIDSPELALYEIGKKINLQYFIETVKRLGSEFDGFIFESEAGKIGKEIVESHIGTVFTKSDGAIIYEGEKVGLHTRVFINSEGYPTYEAKDIGLLSLKFSKYNPDISIFITDHEQTNYFKVVSAAAGEIHKEWQEKTVHRTHGRMTFKGKKMSSRLGGVPLASVLLDTVLEEVLEKAPTLGKEDADLVALSALKFSILRARAGSNINFDPETSLSFEGDSGPYLLYTAIRAKTLIEKAHEKGIEKKYDTTQTVSVLERTLAQFELVLDQAISEWSPHFIASYLLEVSHLFNSWYASTKILVDDNDNKAHQIFIVDATKTILEKGLYVLGITIPEKM